MRIGSHQQKICRKPPIAGLDRILTLELVRVTERAAVAAARLRGRGDEKAADQAAVDAMREELNRLPIDGTVVIGEGERDEAPMLYIGEEVGTRQRAGGRHRARPAGRHDDLRQEPAEFACRHRHRRKGQPALRARRLHGQDRHRPRLSRRRSSISMRRPTENIAALAKAKGVPVSRNHRLHPRPAAPCQADRGSARRPARRSG